MLAEITPTNPLLISESYRPSTLPLFFALSRRKAPYGISRTHCLPHQPSWRFLLRNAVDPAWLGIRQADFAICAGTVAMHHPLIGERTTILQTCAPDVFRMDEVKPDPPYPQPYAVFLDEAITEPHRDYRTLAYAPPAASQYVAELHNEFAKVGIPVISSYRTPGEGSGTANLVFHSSLVLAHSSTAVSFAVLFKKPIKILNLPCFKGRPEERHATAMSWALMHEDYVKRYLGTPEAMLAKRRPEELLEEYLYGR